MAAVNEQRQANLTKETRTDQSHDHFNANVVQSTKALLARFLRRQRAMVRLQVGASTSTFFVKD